jgi:cellobiose phosphorylase
MYRLVIESLLGLAREKDRLRFTPCLPAHWTGFTIRYRHGATTYKINVQQHAAGPGEAAGTVSVTANGVSQPDNSVQLVDDQAEHDVVVVARGRAIGKA